MASAASELEALGKIINVNIRAVAEIIGYSANRLKQCFGRRIDRQPRQCFGVQATDGPMMICKNFFTFED
jgi:hypothetical protein